ncbi:unnamed protein product [[Candida] boidinii]|uniref:Unnamed protein product n=1 Tax=Candida boidinii TaxID=5477 RepID=A0A9W6SVA1_CANBO|nr:hypothetical protein B5S30_g5119 [[Candida] boidinii]GME67836.1 unnamed protein product [[Candida] boidinii]GMG05982.1 unnamed protein product [[Candida] boidinii]
MFKISSNIPTLLQEKEESVHTNDECSDTIQKKKSEVEIVVETESPDDEDEGLGTKKAEAATLIWTEKVLYYTYAWIWVCFFMLQFHSTIVNNVIYYAYNDFNSAPQVLTANILATVVGGVMNIPIATLITIWGRAEGLCIFLVIYMVGIIVGGTCHGPVGYASSYCLFWVGLNGIFVILDVFIADTSGLKNRALSFAFSTSPIICTAFTGPLCATAYLKGPGWRWAYYSFFIMAPFIYGPVIILLKVFERKAIKRGILKKVQINRTFTQSFWFYFKQFDVIGCCLIMAAFILILLPFSLQSFGKAEYKSAKFIVMLIVGVLLCPLFYIWERYYATRPMIKWSLLNDRTVMGACIVALSVNFSVCVWNSYFYNFTIVVYDISTTYAGYMQQIYTVGYTFWSIIFAVWIRINKKIKYTCLLFGFPLMVLGTGLFHHFSIHQNNIGLMIMCQIFIAFGGGTLILGYQMAVMVSATLDSIPILLVLTNLFASIGMAFGQATSTGVYTNVFLKSMIKNLPADSVNLAADLYLGGYTAQMMYPIGDPIRKACSIAWGDYQKDAAIAAICILTLILPSITIWKNYSVDKKQNKGTVL